jgi:hypothetical protein
MVAATVSSCVAFLSSQRNYGQKQRRHIAGKLCGKNIEKFIVQQLFIFRLIVAAQCATISSGIAFFKQPEKLWTGAKTIYWRKSLRQRQV